MKTLCDLSKSQIAERLPQMVRDLPQCQFICKKCARVSIHKKELCKPASISKMLEPSDK